MEFLPLPKEAGRILPTPSLPVLPGRSRPGIPASVLSPPGGCCLSGEKDSIPLPSGTDTVSARHSANLAHIDAPRVANLPRTRGFQKRF